MEAAVISCGAARKRTDMERLTYRLEDQYGNPTDSIILESDLIFLNSSEKWKKVLSRLAAYEDTGLEPEKISKIREDAENGYLKSTARRYGISVDRLRELAEVDREGRCVVLPRLEPGRGDPVGEPGELGFAGVETAYREFAEDVIRQFGYHGSVNGRPAYTAGGLSTLEEAFRIVEWNDPHPAPECECQEEGCHEWATGGRPTPDGYKWLCGRHFAAYDARKEAETALAKLNLGT